MILTSDLTSHAQTWSTASRLNEYSFSARRNCVSLPVKVLMMRSTSVGDGETELLPDPWALTKEVGNKRRSTKTNINMCPFSTIFALISPILTTESFQIGGTSRQLNTAPQMPQRDALLPVPAYSIRCSSAIATLQFSPCKVSCI